MRIDRKPDEVISHKPAVCEGCPYAATCKLRSCETRYEYDVEVKTKLIAHEAMGCDCCHMTGQAERGAFPAHITGTKQYGKGVSALAVTHSHQQGEGSGRADNSGAESGKGTGLHQADDPVEIRSPF